MIPRNRTLLLATAALAAGRLGLGCASQGDGESALPQPSIDGGDVEAMAPVPDASEPAADADAASDADAAPACSADGWCVTKLPGADSFDGGAPANSGSQPLFQMTSLWVAPDHQAWAVTSGGHVLRWDGATWKVVTVVGTTLHAIFGTSATDLWIAGDGALVLHGTVSAGQLTLAPVPVDTYQGFSKIWGTGPSNIWLLGTDGAVFHRETVPDAGPDLVFVPVDLPSDYPGDYNPFRATALWGTGNDLWIAGTDQTYCDPVNCQFVSELVVRKWKGGNAGEASWDRARIPMSAGTAIELYSNVSLGAATSDGVQLVFVDNGGVFDGHLVRIATSDALLAAGAPIHHDGIYSWTTEALASYVGPQGLWATDSKNAWLAGPAGVRHYDGTAWQIGRISVTPGAPLLKDLHSIQGIVAPPSGPDMWTVGDDVALHRTVTP